MEQTVPKKMNEKSTHRHSPRTPTWKKPEAPRSQSPSALKDKDTKHRKSALVLEKHTRQPSRSPEPFSHKLRTMSTPAAGVNIDFPKKQVSQMNNLLLTETMSNSSEEENGTEAESLIVDAAEVSSADSADTPSEQSQWVKTRVGLRLSIPLEDAEEQKESETCNDVLGPRPDIEACEDEPPISIIEIKPTRKKKSQPSDQQQERVKLLSHLFKEETLHLDRLCQIKPILADLKGSLTGQTSAQLNEARKAFELCVDMINLQKKFIMDLRECTEQAKDPNVRISQNFQCLVKKQKYLLSYFQRLPSVLEEASTVLPKRSVIELPRNEKRPAYDIYDVRHKLQEPTTWITQTLENVQRLISATPPDHPDAEEFRALKQQLISLNADRDPYLWVYGKRSASEQPRRIKMHSLVVVTTHPQFGYRKIRYLLLFSDILVCAKAKIIKNSPRIKGLVVQNKFSHSTDGPSSGNLTDEQLLAEEQECTSLEAKWMIPLEQLVILPNSRLEPDHDRMFHKQERIDRLKETISQLRQEKKIYEGRKGAIVRSRRVEANLMKAEGELILETPQLILPISDGEGHTYHILLVTERERDHWRRALEEGAANCAKSNQPTGNSAVSTPTRSGEHHPDVENKGGGVNQSLKINQYPTINEMNTLLKKYHQLVRLNTTGLALLQRFKGITGTLRTTVYKIDGLNKIDSYHVQIEVDSFNRYEEVARTRVVSQEPNPTWNQEFDIPVDDAHMVCFTIYSHCDYLAEYEVPLKSDCLSKEKTQVTLTTNESPPRTINLEFSLRHLKGPCDYKRYHPVVHRNIFGSPAHTLINHDKKSPKSGGQEDSGLSVPTIVVACVDEIERRGLREVGLYRVCGSNTEIQALRDRFNDNQEQAIHLLGAIEIPVLTSLLKLFFRELPEPLLTNLGSQELMKASTISNEDERNLSFSKTLSSLPPVNLETFRYLCQHLVTVSRYRDQNMMDLGNLSMIWCNALFQSPTQTLRLVEPAKESQSFMDSLNKEAAIGFHQTKVLHMILTAARDQKIPILSRSSKSLPASKGRQ